MKTQAEIQAMLDRITLLHDRLYELVSSNHQMNMINLMRVKHFEMTLANQATILHWALDLNQEIPEQYRAAGYITVEEYLDKGEEYLTRVYSNARVG